MNMKRRKSLKELYQLIEDAKAQLEAILEEEEEARDNIPESLQDSERYQVAEEACENMEEAVSGLDDVLEYIESAME